MFITQIIQGEVTELNLCEDCARERGLIDPMTLSFNEKFFPENFQQQIEQLLKKVEQDVAQLNHIDDDAEELRDCPDMSCPICQFTLALYQKTGRLGCPDCYRVFAEQMGMMAAEGLATPMAEVELSPQLQRKNLERQMAKAIEVEDYERAASLRDQLKNLPEQG